MSIEHDYKQLSIIDYEIDTQQWSERVKDQLRPCLETEPLNPDPNVGNFSNLIQFHGLHARVPAINGQLQAILT
jgi:hypothetical protein